MKYLLRCLDPEFPDLWFDTNSVYDLARLGGWDENIVYVAGTAYHAPLPGERLDSPTGPTPTYIRELEAELLAMKKSRDELIRTVARIVKETDAGHLINHEGEEHYLLYWDHYVALHKIAAAKDDTPAYPCEMCNADVGDPKNLHSALAHDGNTYQVCDDCAHQHHRWQEVS